MKKPDHGNAEEPRSDRYGHPVNPMTRIPTPPVAGGFFAGKAFTGVENPRFAKQRQRRFK
jgi:hypothetical protein